VAVKRLSNLRQQYDDGNGVLLSNGRLFFYSAGSSTKLNTYNSSTGTVANTNPIVLNALGEIPVEVWLTVGLTYKLGLAIAGTDDPPASFVWTEDNVAGINDATVTLDQWVSGPAPTYISATSFSLVGDQTSVFHVGRRLKTTNSGGTIYSTITASAFGALTTITVINDSGVLDSGLSAVSYGLGSVDNNSEPLLTDIYPLRSGSSDKTKKVRLEVDGLTTGTTRVITVPDSDITLGDVATSKKMMYGFTYANNGGDSIDVAAGGAVDGTGVRWIIGAALTKSITVNWVVGNAQGGLDTGAVGNNDYYIWAIMRSDTGIVDYLFSLSSTAPTMPASYDFKRLIGWFKRVGAVNVAFHTYETEGGGIEMNWDSPTLDVSLQNTLTTSRRTDALKVPLNFSTMSNLNIMLTDASSQSTVWIYCPDQSDLAPSQTAAPLSICNTNLSSPTAFNMKVRTSSTGTIAARATLATVDDYRVVTIGFGWARRN